MKTQIKIQIKTILPAFLLAVLSVGQTAAHANSWWWKNADHGFEIQMSTQTKNVFEPGESATIQGSAKYLWPESFKKNKAAPKNILKNLKVRAFYPNRLTEVPVSVDPKTLKFSFVTPEINSDVENIFMLQIAKPEHKNHSLNSILAKITRKIMRIDRLKHPTSADLAYRATLLGLETKIRARIQDSLEILAEYEFPIRVSVWPAMRARQTSIVGGFLFNLSFTPGSVPEQFSSHAAVTLTNLRHRTHGKGEYPKSLTRIKFNGSTRPDIEPLSFKFGESVHDAFDTGSLLSGAPLLRVETYKKTRSQHLKRLGMLSLPLFVSGDSSRPVITLTNEEDYGYESFSSLPAPVIKIADSIVGIDTSSINATLTHDGLTTDVTNLFTRQLTQSGRVVTLTGSHLSTVLNADGTYMLTVNAKNAYAKAANPLIFEFRIDRTPPVITSTTSSNLTTNIKLFPIQVSVEDVSTFTVTIKQNGNQVHQTTDEDFTFTASLFEGVNEFKINAVDGAGNNALTYTISNIRLDTVPPIITIALQSPNITTNTQSNFLVTGTCSELGRNVDLTITDTVAHIIQASAVCTGGVFSKNLNLSTLAGGATAFTALTSDAAGNVSTVQTTAFKDLASPVIAMTPNTTSLGVITIVPQVSGTVTDIDGNVNLRICDKIT